MGAPGKVHHPTPYTVVGFSRVSRVSRVSKVRVKVSVRISVRFSFNYANLNRKTLGGELLSERLRGISIQPAFSSLA